MTQSVRLFQLDCGVQKYDWGKLGSASVAAECAKAGSDKFTIDEKTPYAELWMGTHPSVPSKQHGTGKDLRDILKSNPDLLSQDVINKFGSTTSVPFLFKVLSIRKALSIQAHPDKILAEKLHKADPKNYPDDNHKPEMAIALGHFEAFCGFRPVEQIADFLDAIPELRKLATESKSVEFQNIVRDKNSDIKSKKQVLSKIFEQVMTKPDQEIADAASKLVESAKKGNLSLDGGEDLAKLVLNLDKDYPGDRGVFCIFFLNYLVLNAGQAIFLAANEPHAYISGDIVECMAASDNVVRAALTPKYRDTNTLVKMLTYDFKPASEQALKGLQFTQSHGDASVILYDPPISEFNLLVFKFTGGARQKQIVEPLKGPSIILFYKGHGTISDGNTTLKVIPGLVFFAGANTKLEITNEDKDGMTIYHAFTEV